MDRRAFFLSGISSSIALSLSPTMAWASASNNKDIRSAFPRLAQQIYLNAAGGMPLSTFSEAGLNKYINFNRMGWKLGEGEYVEDMSANLRPLFAKLIGAEKEEIGYVHCTKAGEQIVINSLKGLPDGGNIVTNDLIFSRSLHNYLGIKKSGQDVRIVKSENWKVSIEAMKAAIDNKTKLVSVALVSNVNGHMEDIKALTKIAHEHGAIVYADIIQAVGVVPVNVHDMGIDVAACSCYKWLYGVHGTGFIFVSKKLQGSVIEDMLYPGVARPNYQPWVDMPDPERQEYSFNAKDDATRYQPGHINYLGYCAAFEGLKFIESVGLDNIHSHSSQLIAYLTSQLNSVQYQCISPSNNQSAIVTFRTHSDNDVRKKLSAANIFADFGHQRLRISPAIYNNKADMDALISALT